MTYRLRAASETQKRRSLEQRIMIVGIFMTVIVLIIVARLIDLQIVHGADYRKQADDLHYSGIKLPAKRGEIFGVNSKTGEKNIFATNTTLDLAYVDPLITDDPTTVANTLAQILLTEQAHADCTAGNADCPPELVSFYAAAFDPVTQMKIRSSGSILEPLPAGMLPASVLKLPDLVSARDAFARDIEKRISQKRVVFSPLKYGATKVQMAEVQALGLPGVTVREEQALIFADPEEINQSLIASFADKLAKPLQMNPADIVRLLKSHALRYVPIMHRVPPELSRQILEAKAASAQKALEELKKDNKKNATDLNYALRSIALLPEHWRFYPDTTIASHIVGFLNAAQEPQYGIERTFNAQLRGKEGVINAALRSGEIQTDQSIVNPRDGDSIVLTIDRTIQKYVETVMDAAVKKYKAESGQAIVMDPQTGRIIAMANAPLFDSNNYAQVSEKEPITVDPDRRKQIVVEIADPDTHAIVVRAYKDQVFSGSGRLTLPPPERMELQKLEKLYTLTDLTRYYTYISKTLRREIFPTDKPEIWLKFRNDLGIGAYLNRAVQEIYEPGSVMKPIIAAIGIDQGEITPTDTYDDFGIVQVDQFKIDNNDHHHYGRVTMTNCLEFSINTCMTSIAFKLGPKLLHNALDRFGFGKITGIELEDELPGDLRPWSNTKPWSRSLLATTAFGQGISATPLQVITAWAALANGGKLLKPTIIDSVIHSDGTVDRTEPRVVDQVITTKASQTITAMLVSSATRGFAKTGKVPGYRIAGKTGTSQIAGPGGGYASGTGTTFATYAGFAPVTNPKFLVLIKLDRPKSASQGATAAGPIFKDIAAFLFQYYGIPPDER
jgi:cell division protein FtsI/penicillin-binding protein 2